MGDHYSSPRVFADPAADIADVYVFPSPERPGYVVLVLTVFPGAAVTSLFSDAITYRFRIRPVTVAGATRAYAVGENEYTFDFTFTGDGTDGSAQAGRCVTPGEAEIAFRVGEEATAEPGGLRIFAGARLDPFFIGLTGVRGTRQLGGLAFKPADTNANQGQNILAIVLDADLAALLAPGAGSGAGPDAGSGAGPL